MFEKRGETALPGKTKHQISLYGILPLSKLRAKSLYVELLPVIDLCRNARDFQTTFTYLDFIPCGLPHITQIQRCTSEFTPRKAIISCHPIHFHAKFESLTAETSLHSSAGRNGRIFGFSNKDSSGVYITSMNGFTSTSDLNLFNGWRNYSVTSSTTATFSRWSHEFFHRPFPASSCRRVRARVLISLPSGKTHHRHHAQRQYHR